MLVEKESRKVFTNKKSNNIIKTIYNPLNKDCISFHEREGLFMKETNDVILEDIIKELNLIERIFLKKKLIKVYNKIRVNIVNAMLK